MRGDTYFEEQFPSSACHFAPSVLSAGAWREAEATGNLELAWSIALLSDALLSRAASWRQATDFFTSYRCVNQFGLLRQELRAMARGRKEVNKAQVDKAVWIGFLDYRLSSEELDELDAWKPKPQEIWDVIDELTVGGYRLTLSYNSRLKLSSATIIDDDSSRKTGGYALSSADEDGALALKMAVFKHLKLARDWSPLLTNDSPRGKRG